MTADEVPQLLTAMLSKAVPTGGIPINIFFLIDDDIRTLSLIVDCYQGLIIHGQGLILDTRGLILGFLEIEFSCVQSKIQQSTVVQHSV